MPKDLTSVQLPDQSLRTGVVDPQSGQRHWGQNVPYPPGDYAPFGLEKTAPPHQPQTIDEALHALLPRMATVSQEVWRPPRPTQVLLTRAG